MLNGLVAREKHTEAAGKACKERVLCRAPIHPASDVLKYFYFSEAHGPNFMRALFLISFSFGLFSFWMNVEFLSFRFVSLHYIDI